jgi:hypothetical protein
MTEMWRNPFCSFVSYKGFSLICYRLRSLSCGQEDFRGLEIGKVNYNGRVLRWKSQSDILAEKNYLETSANDIHPRT